MVRQVIVATSPEPTGVAQAICRGFSVASDRVTYDGELTGSRGYLFTVEVGDTHVVTPQTINGVASLLSSRGYTSRTLFEKGEFKVQVFKKHYRYAWAALALTAIALYHLQDVHKKPFERVVEQWVDPAWRWLVLCLQGVRIPHSADEWRHISGM